MEIKQIKGFEGYYVAEDGTVLKAMKPWEQKSGYKNLKINGKHVLVHRLVATHFVEGEHSLDVNHKDGDKHNNHYSNLEFVTRAENIKHAVDELGYSMIRNMVSCELIHEGVVVGKFDTVKSACQFAELNYGVSASSLSKNRKVGHTIIKKV